MAYVSRLSDVVKPTVVGESIQEGKAVKIVTSGLGVHNELGVAMLADASTVMNVYCLMTPPDQFDRPTPAGMYTAGWRASLPFTTGYGDPIESRTFYKVGRSVLWNPTLVSGELGQAHRGGTYAVPSGAYIESANIRIPGSMIRVGTSGRWEYTATESEAVGTVDEFNGTNHVLVFTLRQ